MYGIGLLPAETPWAVVQRVVNVRITIDTKDIPALGTFQPQQITFLCHEWSHTSITTGITVRRIQ